MAIKRALLLMLGSVLGIASLAKAQGASSTSISGTVFDPSGAVVANATVVILNPVSSYQRTIVTDSSGNFRFPNVPFNPYHLTVTAPGFAPWVQDVEARSSVPVELEIELKISTSATSVTVTSEAADLIEQTPVNHTDVDRQLFDKMPLESPSSSVSSLVMLATPGIAADSNGLFHGMGDHNEVSFSVDGQPITDQQSKIFSNQIPLDSVQSLEVIPGAPPAEFGDKTSVVIKTTTRSGQGMTPAHGSVKASYGTFGSALGGFELGYGGQTWGNYIAANGLNTSRFLDPPEFTVMHDKGNEENVFDRVDYQPTTANSLQLNFNYTRSWFQNPNTYDQQLHYGIVNNISGAPLSPADQRSQINTINVAPSWTRLVSSTMVFTFGGFLRQDRYNYYPSADPFSDYSPDLQSETASQTRRLTNAGIRASLSYVKGINNVKVGGVFQHTFLTENDGLALVDPTFNPVCFNADGTPNLDPAVVNSGQCGGPLDPGGTANTGFNPVVACVDLTRPTPAASDNCSTSASTPLLFHGHTDVKELALFGEDDIKKGNWSFNLGLRGDVYRAIANSQQLEPRLGAAYKVAPSNSVLRFSYARILETPFNENLIIASDGCTIPVIAAIVPPAGVTCKAGPLTPGARNEYHAGLEQAFGRYMVVNAEYVWKYTNHGFDFGIVGATPITFPVEWAKSKIPGWDLRVSVPDYHGFSAFVVMSSVAARFFLPQVAGIPIIPLSSGVFRIDHDEFLNQTTHLQYQFKHGPWLGFNWRYDSGLVTGSTPCLAATSTCGYTTSPLDAPGVGTAMLNGQPVPSGYVALDNAGTGLPLTADQEFQAGFTCGGQPAAPSPIGPALADCKGTEFGAKYVRIPPPFAENDDHHPQRIAPRHLFDLAVGDDNLFHSDHYKWSLQVTVVNLLDKEALYNYLSTFSGTHFVTPRAITAEIGFHF
jgi:hypothetical protein